MRCSIFLKKAVVVFRRTDGQLLVEMLVALVIGGLLTLTASVALVSLVRYNFENEGSQAASALAYNLMSSVSSFAESGWHNIYDLNKTSGSPYYLVSAPTSSLAVAGSESVFFNDVQTGLIGYWKFDESTGTVAYDSSGNGDNGTLVNAPVRATSSCYAGSCLNFNGTNQYVAIASSLNPTSSVSVTAWFERQGSPTGGYHVIFMQGTQIEMSVSDPGGQIRTGVTTATLGRQVFNSGSGVTDGGWHFLALTYDGAYLRAYIDGNKTLEQAVSGAIQTGSATNIGYYPGYYANGFIDDVRVYNRALSASEISLLYNNKPYTRYFYVDNVSRDASGNIVSSNGTDDPSTQMVHTVVSWEEGRTVSLGQYLTRSKETVLYQNNWRAGSGQTGPTTNVLSGYDTSSNITAGATLALSTTTASGTLTSSIFDTQISGGATINSLLWQGTLNGGGVGFQFAYASNSSGPWNFYGPGASPSTYYTPTNSGIPLAITDINNYRYFRYKIFLTPSGTSTPTVSSVSVGWSW